jgi:hypothetical protein
LLLIIDWWRCCLLLQMALRMERSVANAAAMAEFLHSHPLVKKLNYAGVPSHPGAAVHASQATSGGAVLSFETGTFLLPMQNSLSCLLGQRYSQQKAPMHLNLRCTHNGMWVWRAALVSDD